MYFEKNNNDKTKSSVTNNTLVQTVEANMSHYSRREIEWVEKVREQQAILGHSLQQHLIHLLSNNLLRNYPVTVANTKLVVHIYGTDIASVKGKMTKQHKGSTLSSFNPTPIHDHISKVHKNVTLGIDFLYAQGMSLLHTISREIQFCTAREVENRQKKTIVE